MKTLTAIAMILLGGVFVCSAAAPVKPPQTRYARLISSSPFTVKPVETTPTRVEVNPFEDWALGGISEVNKGFFLHLLNKKKQGEKIVVEPGQPSEYEVVEVRRDPLDPKKTEVVLRKDGQTGTVTYDEKVLAAAPKPPQGQVQQPRPPGVQPSVPQIPGQAPGPGQPRMRVVPPTTNQPGATPGLPPGFVPGRQPTTQSSRGGGSSGRFDRGDRGGRGGR